MLVVVVTPDAGVAGSCSAYEPTASAVREQRFIGDGCTSEVEARRRGFVTMRGAAEIGIRPIQLRRESRPRPQAGGGKEKEACMRWIRDAEPVLQPGRALRGAWPPYLGSSYS